MKQKSLQIKQSGFDPKHVDNLIKNGHFSPAKNLLKKAEKKNPKHFDVLYLKGKLAISQYQLEKAEALFNRALKSAEDINQEGNAVFQLATIYHHWHQLDKAGKLLKAYKKGAWGYDKQTLQYLKVLRDSTDAEAFNAVYPNLKPLCHHTKMLLLCAQCLTRTDQIAEAKALLNKYCLQCDDPAQACVHLVALEVATANFDSALDVIDQLPEQHQNNQKVFRDRIKLNHYLNPSENWADQLRNYIGQRNLPFAEWTLSSLLFAQGQFETAFKHFEARYQAEGKERHVRFLKTRSLLKDKLPDNDQRTLVSFEQGLGDQIRFSRFFHGLSEAEKKALAVVAEERLTPLLQRSFPDLQFFDTVKLETESLKKQGIVDEIMLGSGGLLPSHRENFPEKMTIPYLTADADQVEQWREQWPGNRLAIGVFWRSIKPNNERSLWYPPLDKFVQIFRNLNCQLVCLQNDVTNEELAVFDSEGLALTMTNVDCKDDLDSLASLCASVDVVVGVGTATSELSAALGQKTLTLANRHPDRWYLSQTYLDAFYPDMHMYLNETGTPWTESLQAVRTELEKLARGKSAKR